MKGLRIIAHRGASGDAPENTQAAFHEAWRQGADAIEGDFHLTGDGRMVCIHDTTTTRTAGTAFEVAQTPLEVLRKLDVGSWKGAAWRGERIPTVEEVLALVPADKQIVMEIKCGREGLAVLDAALRRSALRAGQVEVIAFDPQVVGAWKQCRPDAAARWIVQFRERWGALVPAFEEVLPVLRQTGADGLSLSASPRRARGLIERLRHEGYGAHVWTVDTVSQARQWQAAGVQSITTNHPGRVRAGC